MRVIIKIILTIGVIIIAAPISVFTKEVPMMNLILLAGLVGGIRAIWKYNPDKEKIEEKGIDIHKLDKSGDESIKS